MAVYRMDYQLRIPYDRDASGFYYWTNCFYFSADNPTDFDLARDEVIDCVHFTHNVIVQQNRFQIHDVATGILVQNTNAHNVPCAGPTGDPIGVENTMLVWLITAGPAYGYKRFRVPLSADDIEGEYLTDAYQTFWLHHSGNIWASANHQCLRDGTPIIGSVLDPRVRLWQVRHGTIRRNRVRLV